MDKPTLNAERRTVLGKQVKALRREGRIPGVVYGPGIAENVPVTVDRREFERFYRETGHEVPFTLAWGDGAQTVVVREVDEDHLKRVPLHIDFFAPAS